MILLGRVPLACHADSLRTGPNPRTGSGPVLGGRSTEGNAKAFLIGSAGVQLVIRVPGAVPGGCALRSALPRPEEELGEVPGIPRAPPAGPTPRTVAALRRDRGSPPPTAENRPPRPVATRAPQHRQKVSASGPSHFVMRAFNEPSAFISLIARSSLSCNW